MKINEIIQLDEFNVRRSGSHEKITTYQHYDIFVNKKPNQRGVFTSSPMRGDVEYSELRGEARSKQDAINMSKEKIDDIVSKAERISSSATININVDFVRQELEASTRTESGDTFYAKLDQGPSLIVANEEWGDDAKDLGFKKVVYKKMRSDTGTSFTGAVFAMPSRSIASLDLVRHGRYVIGSVRSDKDGNYIFPLEFHSVAAASNDPLKLGVPALGVNPNRN
jgi:hypothetical protein